MSLLHKAIMSGQVMALHITRAKLDDIDPICDIDRSVVGNDSRRDFLIQAVKDGNCFVANKHGAIVGFIVYDTTFYGHAFIWLVMVSPSFRRQGVASALIRHVEICANEKLFTSTNESNAAMKKLCESLEFVRSGWIENLDEGDPEVVYFK